MLQTAREYKHGRIRIYRGLPMGDDQDVTPDGIAAPEGNDKKKNRDLRTKRHDILPDPSNVETFEK